MTEQSATDSALLARLDERTIAIQRDLTEMKASFNSWDSRISSLERVDAGLASKFVQVDGPEVKAIERWERFEQRILAYGVVLGLVVASLTQMLGPIIQKYLGF